MYHQKHMLMFTVLPALVMTVERAYDSTLILGRTFEPSPMYLVN